MQTPPILLLDVTADHIRRGKGGDPEACAIAVALKEQTGADNVEVTGATGIFATFIDKEAGEYTEVFYVGPRSVSKFIERFDAMRDEPTGEARPTRLRKDVCPTTFRLKRQTIHRGGVALLA